MAYYISQGRVEAPIRIDGQLCYSSVANLLQHLCAKNYQNTMQLDKFIAKNKRVHFFAPHGGASSFFLSYLGCHTLPSHASAEACLTGSQAGPMRNPREGTSVVLRDTTRLT